MNKLLLALGLSLSLIGQVNAETLEEKEQVFNPDIARAGVNVPAIDTEQFEVGAFLGTMRLISDSGSSMVYGGRFSYHFDQDFFAEATYALLNLKTATKIAGEEVESNSGSSAYYNVSAGYNLVDGELFVTSNTVMPIQFYGLVGVGQTSMDLDSKVDLLTFNVGIGFRVLLTDAIALRMDIQDHILDPDEAAKSAPVANADKFSSNNMEMTIGMSWFF